MACAVMGMWIRSFCLYDDIRIPSRDPAFHLFFTLPNWCGWVLVENADRAIQPQNRVGRTQYVTRSHQYSYRPYRFIYGNLAPTHPLATAMESCPHCYVSFWSVVIPLAALSAYLILWKPGKRVNQDA